MKSLLLVVALVGLPYPVAAQTQQIHVGVGSHSCGQWLAAFANPKQSDGDVMRKWMMVSWVQGHLVGAAVALSITVAAQSDGTLAANQMRFGTSGFAFDPPDSDAMTNWMHKFCRDKPLSTLAEASVVLVAELFTNTK